MSKIPVKKEKVEKKAHLIGAGLTIGIHLLALAFFFTTVISTVYPTPAEIGIEVELLPEPVPEPPKLIEVKSGNEPRVEKPNPKKR